MPVSQSDRSSTEICKFCDGICAMLRWKMLFDSQVPA